MSLRRGCRHAALALIAVGAFACGDARDTDTERVVPPTDASRRSGDVQSTSIPVRLDLFAPDSVRSGEPVSLRLRATNTGPTAVDLYLRGRDVTFDVLVTRASGGEVWQRLRDSIVPAIVQLRPLAPGASLESSTSWDQRANDGAPVSAGEYLLRAVLLLETDSLRSEPVRLRIR